MAFILFYSLSHRPSVIDRGALFLLFYSALRTDRNSHWISSKLTTAQAHLPQGDRLKDILTTSNALPVGLDLGTDNDLGSVTLPALTLTTV